MNLVLLAIGLLLLFAGIFTEGEALGIALGISAMVFFVAANFWPLLARKRQDLGMTLDGVPQDPTSDRDNRIETAMAAEQELTRKQGARRRMLQSSLFTVVLGVSAGTMVSPSAGLLAAAIGLAMWAPVELVQRRRDRRTSENEGVRGATTQIAAISALDDLRRHDLAGREPSKDTAPISNRDGTS